MTNYIPIETIDQSEFMPVIELYQAPSVEPLSVDDVKQYLRIDGDSEDQTISTMISSARMAAEKYMKLSIISQKWKLTFNETTPDEVSLPYGPVTGIDSVKTIDENNVETVFASSNYYLTAGNLSIYFNEIPSDLKVQIIYNTGFSSSAANVPALIKQGMLAHIAFMFDRKVFASELNSTAKNLYNFYRNINL